MSMLKGLQDVVEVKSERMRVGVVKLNETNGKGLACDIVIVIGYWAMLLLVGSGERVFCFVW
jgi:hypothetical protein